MSPCISQHTILSVQRHDTHHMHFLSRQLLLKACDAQQGVLLRLGRCAGAPQDLVQVVTGYAEAGNALVTGGVDKVIFVGSTGVGKAVMQVNGPHHACVTDVQGDRDSGSDFRLHNCVS